PVNGLPGGTTTPLTANDTLNGLPVTVGTAPGNVTVTPVGTYPTGLTLNPNGTVTVAPNTPAGTYPVTYTICEVSNPTNCSTVTSNVVVSAPAIIAVNDTTAPVNGLTGGTITTPITANDTLNGAPVVVGTAPGNVQITSYNVPSGSGIVVNPNGTVFVPANTPAGTYPVTYTICEVTNPTNCSTATTNVVVNAPSIVAVADTSGPVNGLTGGTTTTPVTVNDTLNGNPVVLGTAPGNVQITSSSLPSGWVMNPNGTVTVPANTIAGTYPITYTICEVTNPTNCSTVTSNIVVSPPAIITVVDTLGPISGSTGGTSTVTLTANDTLNGNPVVVGTAPGNVQITSSTVPVGSGLVVNPNGTVTVAPGTPPGTYPVTYTICEVTNPSNCSTITSNVVVSVITAYADNVGPINGLPGGTTVTLTTNDTLNNNPVVVGVAPGQVTVTLAPGPGSIPAGWVLNANGTVTVPANTPAGTYTVTYTICEVSNPSSCSTVTSNVVVTQPVILAVTDTTIPVNGLPGGTTTPLTTNDTLNGVAVVVGTAPGNVTVSAVGTLPAGLTLNSNGTVTIAPNTPAGTYPVTYTICEVNNPSNCSTVTSYVVVAMPNGLIVNNAVTPNGDGTNDVLYIEGIEFYPNNSVEVYNRWGVLVFETTGYDNKDKAFKGLSDGRITIQRQEELPVGTYYYILRYANAEGENKEQSGYLYINR
ncbi:MAG: gliding motility-associated C-terminal domain-containing protein, partial [Limnohabitans sp.]|nr:gliding motility-associated C-terminal domain-containing protein [Limnohabitans sp.]